ncbi:MAG: 4Fe-4S binding protein [Candidatus Latescibacterota bacterium]
MNVQNGKLRIVYSLFILFSALMLISIKYYHFSSFPVFWAAGAVSLLLFYRSGAVFMDMTVILIAWWLFCAHGVCREIFFTFSLVSILLIMSSYRLRSRIAGISALILACLWFAAAGGFDFRGAGFWEYFIFSFTIAGMFMYGFSTLRAVPSAPCSLDFILCSYSSNTAHYAYRFIEGVKKGGAEVTLHRFHYYKEFDADLKGDALAIAFPVYGWKPPWTFCSYLLKKLPRGNGKPAFVLYTAAGGPENAGIAAWVLLTLKGYRVMGRNWTAYPMNVPTFRLLPGRVCAFLDKCLPLKVDSERVTESGEEFARGGYAGMPFILLPFPLVIVGFLLDNKLLDSVLYWNYARKSKCIRCGLCIRYCPTGRLVEVKGYPRARGACCLCMSCVNLCPTSAMQIAGWTEYGRQYKPRWPELLIKTEEKDSGVRRQEQE